MASPFIAQININAFAFPPKGWALCNGQLLPINQNQALFSLLGTTYGGNGQTNFALPDMQGRAAVHAGAGGGITTQLGEHAGTESVTLSAAQMPNHRHNLNVATDFANAATPGNALPAARPRGGPAIYGPGGNNANEMMNPAAVQNTGGDQPHNNIQPFAVLSFCIALQGIFPSRN